MTIVVDWDFKQQNKQNFDAVFEVQQNLQSYSLKIEL